MKTVSFKEVHKELELESMFLNKNHDINSFKKKGNFLQTIGFTNSIATRIYNGVTDAQHLINEYKLVYPNYKFILQAQLERVLEKYNLYQRDCQYFMGDIPEKNIKDIQNFKVRIDDFSDDLREMMLGENTINAYKYLSEIKAGRGDTIYSHFIEFLPSMEKFMSNRIELYSYNQNSSVKPKIDVDIVIEALDSFKQLGGNKDYSPLTICAVESLFNEDAWKEGKQRIIGKKEIEPKSQVDLDPIVLFEVKGGYLIVTAWGDESNDELIFNESLN